MSYRVVGVTPAGRRQHLAILHRYLIRHRQAFDHYQLWLNTNDPEDAAYIEALADRYPDFYRVVRRAEPADCAHTIHHFWPHAAEPDCVYVRFDDDIVWVDDGAIAALVGYRVANPEPFLVSAGVVCNAMGNFLQQSHGALPTQLDMHPHCFCPHSWKDPETALAVHRHFLTALASGKKSTYQFPPWVLLHCPRFSINCISWFGRDISMLPRGVPREEEHYLSHVRPAELRRPCVMLGPALVAHFAFGPQRAGLLDTDVLDRYARLSGGKDRDDLSIA